MKKTISMVFIFICSLCSFSQSNPCGFGVVSSAASCETCCDACLAVLTFGNCSNPLYSVQWSPSYYMCNACPGTTYTATIQDNYGNTIIDSVLVDTIPVNLSIKEIEVEPIEIYPNPAQNEIIVNYLPENNNEEIVIYDIAGKQVLKESAGETAIDIQNLLPGIYLVTIQSDLRIVAQSKLIKY